MTEINPRAVEHEEYRAGVRELCAQFDSAYWQRVEEQSGYPEAFVAALLRRTRVTVARDLTAKYPGAWPARVRITFADGSELSGAADYPVGNPENPVPTTQLEEKFTGLLAPSAWGGDGASQALAALRSLDSCDDMATILSAFAVTPATQTVSR